MIPNKIIQAPYNNEAAFNFSANYCTKATGQDDIQYWLTVSQPPFPMRTIHPLLLDKKIPFTYSKTQVRRLMS